MFSSTSSSSSSSSSGKKQKTWFTNKKGLRSIAIAAIIFSIIAIILMIILFVLVSAGWGGEKESISRTLRANPLSPSPPPISRPLPPANYYWILNAASHWTNGFGNSGAIQMIDVLPNSCFPNGDGVGNTACCLDYAASRNAIWCLTPVVGVNDSPTYFFYGTGPVQDQPVNAEWNSWILAPIIPVPDMNGRALQIQHFPLPENDSSTERTKSQTKEEQKKNDFSSS